MLCLLILRRNIIKKREKLFRMKIKSLWKWVIFVSFCNTIDFDLVLFCVRLYNNFIVYVRLYFQFCISFFQHKTTNFCRLLWVIPLSVESRHYQITAKWRQEKKSKKKWLLSSRKILTNNSYNKEFFSIKKYII